MRTLKVLFLLSLTLHTLPTLASGDTRSGCESQLTGTQLSVYTRIAQAAFEISLANGGNVSVSVGHTDGKVEPTILIRIDLQPEDLDGNYRLYYSSGQEELKSQIMVPRVEIRIKADRIVIFQARARAVKIDNTLVTTDEASHGNALVVAYPGSKVPVIDSGIVPSRMVFNSQTLFGRYCLEIAKVAGLEMSSNGAVHLRTLDGSYSLSGDGWVPLMSSNAPIRRLQSR